MSHRTGSAISHTDIELQTKQGIEQVLGSLPAFSFDGRGTWIAPFVNLGPNHLSERVIERRHLAAPLVGARLIPEVALNVSYGSGVFVDSPAIPLTNILIGQHCKALPLGDSPEGNKIYLTQQGYIGGSVPATPHPFDRDWKLGYPLRTSADLDSSIALMDWQTNYNFSFTNGEDRLRPAVSLHPDRHISRFPDQLLNLLGFFAEQAGATQQPARPLA